MQPELHPWVFTAEAMHAAHVAMQKPISKMPVAVARVGLENLESEALMILVECALPPRDQFPTQCMRCGASLERVRKGAKFCSPDCRKRYAVDVQRSKGGSIKRPRAASVKSLAPVTQVHVGSMHAWPESDRGRYAAREIGMVLLNWLRGGHRDREIPVSPLNNPRGSGGGMSTDSSLENLINKNSVPESDQSPYGFLTEFLESKGLTVMGDESFEELAMAAMSIKGFSVTRVMGSIQTMVKVAS